jgi:hypothetical protein
MPEGQKITPAAAENLDFAKVFAFPKWIKSS